MSLYSVLKSLYLVFTSLYSVLKVALTSFNTSKRHSSERLSLHTVSRNSNVMVPYETSIIAEQDAVIIMT